MKRQTILNIYTQLNQDNFNNVLTMPRIYANRSRSALASYEAIQINKSGLWIYDSILWYNPRLLDGYAWARNIIYHEMIHQFVEEILKIDERNHHGQIFRRMHRKLDHNKEFKLFAGI